MKINNYGTQGINPYKKITKLEQAQNVGATKGTDKVEISLEAKELQQVSQSSAARAEKVESLKQQVQAGTYEVNAKDIANGILNFYKKQ